MADLLCLGEPLIEYNQTDPAQPDRFLRGVGGDVSNVAIAAARQGCAAGMVGALGADEHAAAIRAVWRAEGVDDDLVATDPEAPTGVYFVSHGPKGHSFAFLRAGSAAARFGPDRLPLAAIAAARALHLSGISLAISDAAREAGFAAMRAARAGGALTCFDTNLRPALWPEAAGGLDRAREAFSQALALADVALPGADDLSRLMGSDDPAAQIDWCREQGCAGLVVLKRGAEGARLATPEGQTDIPPRRVSPVDATGAGDCFDGAFLARMLAGDAPEAAARWAACAAALSTTGFGAVAPIPRAEAVSQALAAA